MTARRSQNAEFERLKREIEAQYRAASRRIAGYAGEAARDLKLDRLAERFFAEAEGKPEARDEDAGQA